MSVGRGASEEASALVRSPGHHIHGSCVKGEVEDLGPRAAAGGRGRVLMLFAPDEDLAIVGGRCENCAEFGVRLYCQYLPRLENGTRNRTIPMQHTTPRLHAFNSSATGLLGKRRRFELTPSASQQGDASRLQSQRSLSSCLRSMLPTCDRNNPDRHRARCTVSALIRGQMRDKPHQVMERTIMSSCPEFEMT